MVHCQPMADSRSAVVRNYVEVLKAKRVHQLHLVARHFPFAVGNVIVAALRLTAIAIAAQVSRYDGETFSQLIGNFVPDDMSLWVAVKQQQGRPGTAFAISDSHAVDFALVSLKLLEHGITPQWWLLSLGADRSSATVDISQVSAEGGS
jgi:hypothetical protein